MVTKATLKLEGVEEYLKKLNRVGEMENGVKKALRKGANVLRRGMRRRAPKLTGNLRNKIQVKGPCIEGNKIYIDVGLIHDLSYTDAETARYGNVQEYGSAHTPAHPFIRPTMIEDAGEAMKAVKEELEKELKEWGF